MLALLRLYWKPIGTALVIGGVIGAAMLGGMPDTVQGWVAFVIQILTGASAVTTGAPAVTP